MTPITFHDAQTNKPITLFKNDETSRPLIFSPSKNSGLQKICLNQLKEPYNNDKNIGVLKNFKLIFLDHFESIEKNKKKTARTTIGINTAL